MAITYEYDVGPHLRRAEMYRQLRLHRQDVLHRHHGRRAAWAVILPSLTLFWAWVIYAVT